MKTQDINKILDYIKMLNLAELSDESRKLCDAFLSLSEKNTELITFIQNKGMASEYKRWRKNK